MFNNRRASRATETSEPNTSNQSAVPPTSRPGSEITLRSLAPEYKKEHHATYVRHLEAAVLEPKNTNIALTGRYGSGKSSILDNFLEGQKVKQKKTLRISINTLGPDDDNDLTNRIQKELVKQLVYRAEPGEIRHSRFARRKDPTWQRTLLEAVGIGIGVVGLLGLFGVRPDVNALGTGHVFLPTTAFLVMTVGAAWAARWVIGNRLVSQFSTGGTSISFDKEPDSYFDEYLDEIVAFFDATAPDVVVFEDLDRFDDPRIFDSLRELNTLINASAHWKDRKRPLRFVYAIKDSLFEKLGEDAKENDLRKKKDEAARSGTGGDTPLPSVEMVENKRSDTAKGAVERANRTKFFEIVIPVVPFLSHNNARDLLSTALDDLKLPEGTEINRRLLDLVARHATDMRLLINICNEYVVYAQRLLWVKTPTPSLTADDLFALVVYKNFHLADFEKLPHRGSELDVLETKRQEVVRESIKRLNQEKRELLQADRVLEEQVHLAKRLGDRLMMIPNASGSTISSIRVGGRQYASEAVYQPAFWKDIAETRKLSMELRLQGGYSASSSYNEAQLKSLFLEGIDSQKWRGFKTENVFVERNRIDSGIAFLRGADFADLARDKNYESNDETFDGLLESVLDSHLARDLVRAGFINRYYAEYSTAFYGKFLGVDVANFFRNTIWPNQMDTQFKFTTPYAVRNLLEQAPEGFTSSRSVLNIQIVDYMLANNPVFAQEVVTFLVMEQNDDSDSFLDDFLNDDSSNGGGLIGQLATQPWSGLFDHLALQNSVTDEATRTSLLDAALLSAQNASLYVLGERACELIVDRHGDLTAFTQDQSTDKTTTVNTFLHQTGLIVPSLRRLSQRLRLLVVDAGTYEINASNLRSALDFGEEDAITLDVIRNNNAVWRQCKENIETYLNVVEQDSRTVYSILDERTLKAAISEQFEFWSADETLRVLESCAPESALENITEVPTGAWSAIIRARRVEPSARNLFECTGTENVNADLAVFLESVNQIQGVNELSVENRYTLALRILNSKFLVASKAVAFVKQLDLQRDLSVSDLEPREDDLLARLLEAKLVPDEAATFTHFIAGAGWLAVSAASEVSECVEEFLSPALVSAVVADLLEDPRTPRRIKTMVVTNLGEYVESGNDRALREAGQYARKEKISLPITQIERIADSHPISDVVIWQLDDDKSLSADDLMRVLAKLGGDYQGFGMGVDHKFDIVTSPEMGRILDRLTKEKRIEAGKAVRGRRAVRINA